MPRDGPISILPWDEQMGAGGRRALIPTHAPAVAVPGTFPAPGEGGGASLREEPAAQNVREQRPATNAGSLESGGSCLSGSGPEAKSSLPPGLCELPCAHF